MYTLAIDTSSKYFSLGIAKDDKILQKIYKPLGTELSRLIMPEITMALKRAKLPLRNIDYFAVGLGPGSFTGLRIGLSTIKGFAFCLDKPIVGIISLDTIAHAASFIDGWICPIIDAKRGLVYSAVYNCRDRQLRRKGRYLLVSIEELLKDIKEKTFFLGDGLLLYRRKIERALGKRAVFSEEDQWYPRPENILRLVEEKIKKKAYVDSDRITPLYLYPKECQVTINKLSVVK